MKLKGALKLFEVCLQVVIGAVGGGRMNDVVVNGSLGVLEESGEKFCSQRETTIVKGWDAIFCA